MHVGRRPGQVSRLARVLHHRLAEVLEAFRGISFIDYAGEDPDGHAPCWDRLKCDHLSERPKLITP